MRWAAAEGPFTPGVSAETRPPFPAHLPPPGAGGFPSRTCKADNCLVFMETSSLPREAAERAMAYTPPGETRRRVYRWVRDRLLAGAPPTVREVQERFGFRAVETARAHLEALVREGLLVKVPGRARGYRLPGAPPRLVPLLGRVPAGGPEVAVEDPEGWLPAGARSSADELFALRVRGESMTGAGILPGDIVVVRRQDHAREGEIVVALVGDEATVKVFRRRGKQVVLEPANPAFTPLLPDPRELRILGRVIEVRRYLDEPPPLLEPPPA